MKITTTAQALISALKIVRPVVGTNRYSLDALRCIIIRATNQTVTLTGTNLEAATQVEVKGCAVIESGEALVDFKQVWETLSHIKTVPITVELVDGKLVIKGKARTTFKVHDIEEFPLMMPTLKGDEDSITVAYAEFVEALQYVLPSVSTDDARPVLTGALIQAAETGGIFINGADSFRLSRAWVQAEGNFSMGILVPAATLMSVLSVLPKGTELLTLTPLVENAKECSRVLLTADGVTSIVRMIEGTYPNIVYAIPSNDSIITTSTVSRADLLEAYEGAIPVAKDAANVTKLIVNGHIEVKAESVDNEQEYQMDVPSSNEGEETWMYTNVRYMVDALKSLKGEKDVCLSLSGPSRPVVIRPISKPYVHVMTPMSVRR